MADLVALDSVTFRRGANVILNDVSFVLGPGTFLGIIGPNGGGKTTLLRLILGLLKPQEGTISILGRRPADLGAERWRIGYVPQKHEIDKRFPATALDVVLMGGYRKLGLFRRVPAAMREAGRHLLEQVGVAGLDDRPIGRLSGGQQQRVFIARALLSQPDLLILDEPTAGLDSTGQQQILHLVRDLQQMLGIAVIMVSHDVGQLAYYSDRIACMNRKLHWHDRSDLLTDDIIRHLYSCELDAYRERIREIGPEEAAAAARHHHKHGEDCDH